MRGARTQDGGDEARGDDVAEEAQCRRVAAEDEVQVDSVAQRGREEKGPHHREEVVVIPAGARAHHAAQGASRFPSEASAIAGMMPRGRNPKAFERGVGTPSCI